MRAFYRADIAQLVTAADWVFEEPIVIAFDEGGPVTPNLGLVCSFLAGCD
jgi:hypothetical protein